MYSVAIPSQTYLSKSREIINWINENNVIIHKSIKHPLNNYNNDRSNVVITFDDPEVAMLFKLIWG